MKYVYICLCALVVLFEVSCNNQGKQEIVIFAASSLTDVFQEIGEVFQEDYPEFTVLFNFSGSSTLRMQLDFGAQADLFASANSYQIALALENNTVIGNPEQFATNELILVSAKSNTRVNSLHDLKKQGVKIILGSSLVPIGVYTNEVLDNLTADPFFGADYREKVEDNIVSFEPNVRIILSKVLLKQADAAFVYSTDINHTNTEKLKIITIPLEYNVSVGYFILGTADSLNSSGASKFIQFLESDQGIDIFKEYGFKGNEF